MQLVLQGAGELAQHLVTDRMAVGIVDRLEVVDVQHHQGQRQRLGVLLAALQQRVGTACEGAAGEHAGEVIDGGLVRQAGHEATVGLADAGHHQRPEHQHGDAQARRHQRGHPGLALRHAEMHEVLRHGHDERTAGRERQQ
ncbi:hypothetical protein D3C75_1064810 [compost metagenome]